MTAVRPTATYRLQLHPGFGFDDAAAVVDYLAELGISHVYCSPYLQAAAGSTHGYDVVDPTRVSHDLGDDEAHARFCATLRRAGLGQILDIVPNHMAATAENPWWWDVLEHGRASRYANYFDIDWDPPDPTLKDRVLLPVLGDELERVLASDELRIDDDDAGRPILRYHDQTFPLAPGTAAKANVVDVLEQQHYRLAHWRTAIPHINYRRFFDITTLVALRMEEDDVFAAVHDRVMRWLETGTLDGVRIDHIDGLRDPTAYLHRIRAAAPPATWMLVEKILEPGERLPSAWPCDGTTGYDALTMVGGLFVDASAAPDLTALYEELTGQPGDYADVSTAARLTILDDSLAADLARLSDRADVRAGLRAIAASFPVYRTYTSPDGTIRPEDRAVIEEAVAAARSRHPDLEPDLIARLHGVLTGDRNGPVEAELRLRFQQLTAPMVAKGDEDTAFYRHTRFMALNEVGGDPDRFGTSTGDFHDWCESIAARWPATMTTLSTHDTKRSEDVRARLAVITEVPDAWATFARKWIGDGDLDAATAYGFLQNLVGAWPIPKERFITFARKAAREAKVDTSWTDPDPDYEATVAAWVDARYTDPACTATDRFVADVVGAPGLVKSLAQKLVQLTMPGIPDLYQGCELWDFSLVDPDNRRPVDYGARRRLIAADERSHPKLWLVRTALQLRRRVGDLGGYRRIDASDGVVAFAREAGVITVVPRFPTRRYDLDVDLPPGEWRDLLPGLPVRLLERAP